jgi:hypothetical protein
MKGKLGFHDFWPLLKQTGSEWLEDKATKMAGALAYYSATSIAPMLVIADCQSDRSQCRGSVAGSNQQGLPKSFRSPRHGDEPCHWSCQR